MTALLEIENVTVSFDGFKALNDLNFAMNEGELRVIIGPNGAGKTTFLDVITGKVQPTSGEARFKGKNLRKQAEHAIARLGIGRKFQTPRVYLNLSPRENLEISCNRNKNVFATLFKKTPPAEKRTVSGLLETIGLDHKADIPADLLSHGEKQWLEIGMLVAQSPDLLLVDEPVAGLTDEETEQTGDLLMSLAQSHSIIVIEHDMEFVRQIANQVTVLHEGSVLFEGTMDEVQNDPRVIEVYLGQETSVTPEQMLMLRIAATMAWADGTFDADEQSLVLERLSQQFARDPSDRVVLKENLKALLAKAIPLKDLVPQLQSDAQREQVLMLSYDVISVGQISPAEATAYQTLLALLSLPPETVRRLEAAAFEEMTR
jgi:urea transport system ATP-binding protein